MSRYKESVKVLIELSTSFEEADTIINKYGNLLTYEEKIKYLRKMFDCNIIDRIENTEEADYIALLTAIVNQKWR